MLQSMRKMVKSWVAKTLIALLVLSFAAWGIGDIFISRSQGVVASVGDREVDPYTFANAFYARLEQIAQGGQEFDVAEAIDAGHFAEDFVGGVAKALAGAARPLIIAGCEAREPGLLRAAANIAWALRRHGRGREAMLALTAIEANS